MAKKNREINVFSTSAIDLFASALGVFIVLVMILFPYFGKKSVEPPTPVAADTTNVEELKEALKKMTEFSESLEQKVEETQKKLQKTEAKTETLQKEIKEKKVEITTLKAQIPEPQPEPTVDPDANLKKLKKVIQALKQVKTEKETIEARNQELEQQVQQIKEVTQQKEQIESQNQQLKKQLEELKESVNQSSQQENSNFMAVIIQWPTLKHDIDLKVISPSKKKYDFKKRRHKGNPAQFTLDSRTGPGSEVWQTSELEPGVYKIKYKFYNQYGNTENAKVQGSVFTK